MSEKMYTLILVFYVYYFEDVYKGYVSGKKADLKKHVLFVKNGGITNFFRNSYKCSGQLEICSSNFI